MARYDELIFDARSMSPTVVADTIRAQGCVQIKGALDPTVLREVRRTIQSSEHANAPWVLMIALEDIAGRMSFPLIRALHRSPVLDIVRAHFRARRLLITCLNCFYRRVEFDVPESALPFHQDGAGFSGGIPAMTVSVLVDPDRNGGEVPGLQFIPGFRGELLARREAPSESAGVYDFLEIQRTITADLLRQGSWEPVLELGDVLMFDKFCVHRSHVLETMRRPRTSIDVRMFPYSKELHNVANHVNRWFIDDPQFLRGPVKVYGHPERKFHECDYEFDLLESSLIGRFAHKWSVRAGLLPGIR